MDNPNLSFDIEKLICKLPDVISCRVIEDEGGKIIEVHVLTNLSKNTKQLVRDIQSAINAQFGLDIDYKIISIAQIEEKDIREKRIMIKSISLNNSQSYMEACVVLVDGEGSLYEGRCQKIKSRMNKLKVLSEATIAALEKYISISGMFFWESIDCIAISNRNVIVCLVGTTMNNTDEILVGSSIIRADENEAVVKSVLDAVNRRINLI